MNKEKENESDNEAITKNSATSSGSHTRTLLLKDDKQNFKTYTNKTPTTNAHTIARLQFVLLSTAIAALRGVNASCSKTRFIKIQHTHKFRRLASIRRESAAVLASVGEIRGGLRQHKT